MFLVPAQIFWQNFQLAHEYKKVRIEEFRRISRQVAISRAMFKQF